MKFLCVIFIGLSKSPVFSQGPVALVTVQDRAQELIVTTRGMNEGYHFDFSMGFNALPKSTVKICSWESLTREAWPNQKER